MKNDNKVLIYNIYSKSHFTGKNIEFKIYKIKTLDGFKYEFYFSKPNSENESFFKRTRDENYVNICKENHGNLLIEYYFRNVVVYSMRTYFIIFILMVIYKLIIDNIS